MSSDVAGFTDAIGRGAWREAVESYGGPFLPGFDISGLHELSRWIDRARERLAREHAHALHAHALHALARDAQERGEHADAAEWWRRLVALGPLSTGHTLGLLHALARAGERAEALALGQAHARLLREELEPEPAVREAMDRIRELAVLPTALEVP